MSSFRFLDLPKDVRLLVYELLPYKASRTLRAGFCGVNHSFEPAILRTSRQVYAEACPMIHRCMRFHASFFSMLDASAHLKELNNLITATPIKYIKTLVLYVDHVALRDQVFHLHDLKEALDAMPYLKKGVSHELYVDFRAETETSGLLPGEELPAFDPDALFRGLVELHASKVGFKTRFTGNKRTLAWMRQLEEGARTHGLQLKGEVENNKDDCKWSLETKQMVSEPWSLMPLWMWLPSGAHRRRTN
ncbi:hypothetical protein K402DRAFT_416198 [Aulographum hederae CBS 113979]|uniref:F-box domain-containing protein n=1 Tax=Aulographum hederae CBS 113979 TaxID=1176131 RepID=A0A6G1HHY0_9PEZI|nr:hypothetical protein K402DRAFT_416198 [Aulographum hederae CBS 113979]